MSKSGDRQARTVSLEYAQPAPSSGRMVAWVSIVVGCVIFFAIFGGVLGRIASQFGGEYSSSAIVYVNAPNGAVTPVPATSLSSVAATIQSEAFVRNSLTSSGLSTANLNPAEVLSRLAVMSVPSSSILVISIEDRDPKRAAAITTALSTQVGNAIPNVNVLQVSSNPFLIGNRRYAPLGLLLGAFVGLLLPFAWRRLRRV